MKVEEILNLIGSYSVNKMDFEPFKVSFSIHTPIALSHPWLHFDGIIAHLLIRKLLGSKFYLLPTNFPLDLFSKLKIPLRKTRSKGRVIYNASISFFNRKNLFATTIYKRFDDKHLSFLHSKKKKVNRASGHFKDHAIKLPYIPATEVIFYGNGNLREIDSLLRSLPGLGKKIAIGYGFINRYKIKPTREDKSLIYKNRAMRPLPIEFVEVNNNVFQKILLAYKFPYWGKQNICLCIPPGEKIG